MSSNVETNIIQYNKSTSLHSPIASPDRTTSLPQHDLQHLADYFDVPLGSLVAPSGASALAPCSAGLSTVPGLAQAYVVREETAWALYRDEVVELLRESPNLDLRSRWAKLAGCSDRMTIDWWTEQANFTSTKLRASVTWAWRCKDTICPTCIASRRRGRVAQIRGRFEAFLHDNPGHQIFSFTLTQPRVPMNLTEVALDRMKVGLNKLLRRKDWPATGHLLMFEPHIGDVDLDPASPVTAHVHVHAVGLVPPNRLKFMNKWNSERLATEWTAMMDIGHWLDADLRYSYGHSPEKVVQHVARLVAYGSKGIYLQGKDPYGPVLNVAPTEVGADESIVATEPYTSSPLSDPRVLEAYVAHVHGKGLRLFERLGLFRGMKNPKRAAFPSGAQSASLRWSSKRQEFRLERSVA